MEEHVDTKRSRVPHWGWLLLGGLVSIVIAVGLMIWIPYQRDQAIVHQIEQLGGTSSSYIPAGCPKWLRDPTSNWRILDLGDLPWFQRAWQIRFKDAVVTRKSFAQLVPLLNSLEHFGGVHFVNTKIEDYALEKLNEIQNLKSMSFYATILGDDKFRHLKNLNLLEELYLENPGIRDADMKNLVGLRNLELLWISDTRIGDEGLKYVSGLPNLSFLKLSNTDITDDGLRHLHKASKVEQLELDGTQITGSGLRHLSGHKALGSLTLDRTSITDDDWDEIIDLIKKTPTLRSIGLRDTSVTGDAAEAIERKYPHCRIWTGKAHTR